MKGDISVSEKEEKMMDNFIKTIPKLSERHQGYLVGLAEGMALMSEKSSDGEDSKKELERKQQDKTCV